MKLTTTQKVTLKDDILAKQANGQPLAGVSDENVIADYYNTTSASKAWRSDTSVSDIQDAIDWTKYTPTDVPSISDTQATSLAFQSRAWMINIKQMNLQNLTVGRTILDTSKVGNRTGLRDTVIAIPSGVSGANTSAGGASGITVLTACTRLMNRAEALFASVAPVLGGVTASIMAVEGTLTAQEVSDAINGL